MGLAERIAPGDAKIVSRLEGERRVHAGTRGLAELAVVEAVAKPAAIVAAVHRNLAEEVRGERARDRNGLGEIWSGLDARLRLDLERGAGLGRADEDRAGGAVSAEDPPLRTPHPFEHFPVNIVPHKPP